MEGEIPSTWETIKEIFFFLEALLYTNKKKKKFIYYTMI